MRKKQANMFYISPTLSTPPYLSAQELAQFQSEFTLFDSELDLRKLKESFLILNTTIPTLENYKPIESFITNLTSRREKCTFTDYISAINDFFTKHQKADICMEVLSQNKGDISRKMIQEILEETMSRQVPEKELSQIISKVFDIQSPNQNITKGQIKNLFESTYHQL